MELRPFSWERLCAIVEACTERLLRSTAALEAAHLPYAVIGGHACASWVARIDDGATRTTPEVNVLIRREDLATAKQALVGVGFVPVEHPNKIAFVAGPNGSIRQGVFLHIANEKFEPTSLEPAPDVTESEYEPGGRFRIIKLEPLLRTKLVAWRTKDRMHIRDLIDIGLVDSTWTARLSAALAARLKEILDDPNG